MRRKLVKILLILIIAIFALQLKVQAAVITSTDKEVQSNSGSVTISVNSKQALGSFKLKLIDTAGLTLENATKGSSSFEVSKDKLTITGSSSDGITSLGSFTFKIPTVTTDTTYKIKFSISGMETTELETITDETNTAILTVKAPVAKPPVEDTPTTNGNTQTQTPSTTVTKSTEARLKNFGIKPNDFSGFKKDKTEYSATVPNGVEEVNVYAETVDSKATVTGTGKVALKEGNNTVKVTVTAEDGKTTKTYTLTIKRKTVAEETVENGEARLKSLGIKPEEYDFSGFDSEKTEYSAEVPYEVEEIEIYATAMNSSAQITGTGMITLEEGLNELEIEVIAADGTKKTYKLNVTRKEADDSEVVGNTTDSFGLLILTVQGFDLSPKFDAETYEYTIDLKEDIDSLEIGTRPTNDEATVEIVGNENLQEGENVITILVTDKETEEVATYQIIVNKNLETEEIVKTSWLNPSTWGKEEIIKIVIIIVLILLIICAVILKIKISQESNSERNVDLPGAKELDRAIAEHQELSIEDNNVETNYAESVTVKEQNYIEDIAKNRFAVEDFEEKTKRKGRHF